MAEVAIAPGDVPCRQAVVQETSYASCLKLQDCEELRARLAAGAVEADARLGPHGRTLLHVAVLAFRPDLVEVLLDFGADPLLGDATGATPYSLCQELIAAARAGGAEVDQAPLAARLGSVAGLLEYPVAMQNLFYDCGVTAYSEVAAPPLPSPLIRLTSTGHRVRPPPPAPQMGSLARTSTVEGATQSTAGADLAAARAALSRRLEQGVQVFSDIGLWCLLSLQEREDGVAPALPPARPRRPAGAHGEALCGICFEASGEDLVVAPCGMASCAGKFCKSCLTAHVRHSVGELRYALPLVRCPECRRRVPTSVWESLLADAGESDVPARMTIAGQALMKVRCPSCHTTRDLLQFAPGGVAEGQAEISLGEGVLKGLPADQCLLVAKQATLFRRGGRAEALLDALEAAGEADGAGAAPAPPQIAFEVLKRRFLGLCRLLGDVERATALQLAFYRRHPLIQTPCCRAKMCFKCKVKGHHEGMTCEARQAQEMSIEAQYCPTCGVPTVKSEGCNHIVCVCGASWQWRKD